MQEEILLTEQRSGTTVIFFDSAFPEGENDAILSSIVVGENGTIKSIQNFDGQEVWLRNENNHYVQPNEFDVVYTGASYSRTYSFVLSEAQRENITQQWYDDMNLRFGGNSYSRILFRDSKVDDFYVRTKIVRTRGTLDTLDVYNNLTNRTPVQESDTGTLVGSLNAIQEIRDESGNKIKIPLANVPIGVFLASEEFPSAGAVDSEGDRITLNLRESSDPLEYFDNQSFVEDTQNYLRSGSEIDVMPEHYKLMTHTNENGEFTVHNVPTGSQVLLFEVDLFKQGLTTDEIQLNNFPFPTAIQPNLDTVPSLFFRQIPIDVIPTWGDFQTGYTEVNINVNLDLRKWVTYYTPPISYEGKSIEELQARGFSSPLTFNVRNMAADGFPISKLSIVEIQNMFDRDEDARLKWNNEFAQLKRKAEFRTRGYHAFKLPANIYDPEGFRTDANGVPTQNKGVWLGAYQFSMEYIGAGTTFRRTGSEKRFLDGFSNVSTRDHFNLNRNATDLEADNTQGIGIIGQFPYERRWSANYPEPYSIPAAPTQQNPLFYELDDEGRKYVERPRFTDGDMIGYQFTDFADGNEDAPFGTGGYGVTYDNTNQEWFRNDFSKTVTRNFLYKYEQGVSINERYANGYMPNIEGFEIDAGVSTVVGGEKYQRLEAGYGYFLRPEGFPRVFDYPWWGGSEAMLSVDTDNPNSVVSPAQATNNTHVSVRQYQNSVSTPSFEDGRKVLLEMGSSAEISEGGIDIYRIIDPSQQNLVEPNPTPIEQSVRLNFQRFYSQRGKSGNRIVPAWENSGQAGGRRFWRGADGIGGSITMNEAVLEITNKGVVPVTIMGFITLEPNQSFSFNNGTLGEFDNLILELPTNFDFNFDEFKYEKARYDMRWRNVSLYNGGNNPVAEGAENFDVPINALNLQGGPQSSVPNYYLRTRLLNLKTNYNDGSGLIGSEGCKDFWVEGDKGRHSVEVNGMAIVNPQQNKGGWYDSRFVNEQLGNYTCSGSFGNENLIPYRLT